MTNRRRMDDAYIPIRPRSSDCGCVYGCLASSVRSRLSLSQRERMKVRDCFAVAPRVRTRLLATRYRALGESDDSRISTRQLHGTRLAKRRFRTPLTSILSPQAGRGGYASAFNV